MRLTCAALVVCAASLAHAEENPHLARARAELNELRYDKAKETLEQALKWGKSSTAETAEIYRLSGEVSAAFGDAKKAEDTFGRLLAIDPSVRLPAGVSPRISAPFNAALKTAASRSPIKIHHESRTGDSPTITLVVDSDPLDMVKGARASFDGPGGRDTVDEKGKERIELKLPPAAKLTVTLAAIDEHGNRLAELGADEPIVIQAGGALGETGGGDGGDIGGGGGDTGGGAKPFYTRWYLWGGIAIGLAGAGTYFGLAAKSAEDDVAKLNAMTMDDPFCCDFSEAKEIEDRAKRNALLANINFAAAGAFAVVGSIFLIRDLMGSDDEATALAPMPLRGGAGVTFSTSF
jgi:hypothetical protein